jgi:quercetin dioxygenase-like cupin family protein
MMHYCRIPAGYLRKKFGAKIAMQAEDSPMVERGDMFLTRPGDVHRLYNEGDGPFRLLVFKTNAARQDTSWLEEITDEQ